MTDDRGQDIVEIVGHAARQLPDRLHLGGLRHLALELGLLAIVLEQQQHDRIAQPAQPGDGQSDRFLGIAGQPDRNVPRHRRPARVAANRIGNRGLVFLGNEVAGIDQAGAAADPGGGAEAVVHRQEAAVAVDQRKPDRKDVQHRLQVRRARQLGMVGAVEQIMDAKARRRGRIDRDEDRAKRSRALPFGDQPVMALALGHDEIAEPRARFMP